MLERLAVNSRRRDMCECRVQYAEAHWDLTVPSIRAELRQWRRRRFFARWGRYLAALIWLSAAAVLAQLWALIPA